MAKVCVYAGCVHVSFKRERATRNGKRRVKNPSHMELHNPIFHRPGKETNLLLRIKQGSMRAEPMTQCLVSCHHRQQPHPVKLYSTALSFSTKICSLQYQDLLKKDR